jgi:hypothetical protein
MAQPYLDEVGSHREVVMINVNYPTDRKPKASDIPDEIMYLLIEKITQQSYENRAYLAHIAAELPDVPLKVVRAKLSQMINKKRLYGWLNGCNCGECNGDFHITPKGQAQRDQKGTPTLACGEQASK